MNTANVISLVEQLEDNIDDLEENLEPLIAGALSASTKKLPLLDKAKLYVVVVYAIESLLFSYLRLHGVAAKDHPVFRELTRVKQYFEKIKEAENGPPKSRENLSLNKQAAGRIIKHALSGNDKYDLERAEREAREKFLAKRKLMDLEKKMKEKAEAEQTHKEDETIDVDVPADEEDDDTEDDESNSLSTTILSSDPLTTLELGTSPVQSKKSQARGKRKRGGVETKDTGQGETRAVKKARKRAEKAVVKLVKKGNAG